MWTGDRGPDRAAGGRSSHRPAVRHPALSLRARGARPEGRASARARRAAPGWLRAGARRRNGARAHGRHPARAHRPAHDRSPGQPARRPPGRRPPTRRLAGRRLPSRKRHGAGGGERARRSRPARALLQRATRLPRLRGLLSRAFPALLLLQQSARRVPRLQRARSAASLRSGPRRGAPGPAVARGARIRCAPRPVRPGDDDPHARRTLRLSSRDAVCRPSPARAAGGARGLGRRGARVRGSARGAPDDQPSAVRRHPRAARAPSTRYPLALAARGARGPGGRPPMPHVRGDAAPPRGALRSAGREEHRGGLGALGRCRRQLLSGPRVCAYGGRDRAPHPEGGPCPARLSRRRRSRLSVARPRGGDALGRRGPAHPTRDPDRLTPGRRALHSRRALDRAPPARHGAPARHAS